MHLCTASRDFMGVVSALILIRLGYSDEIIINGYRSLKAA